MTIQNTLWNKMTSENNVTTTENGDKAYKSALNPLLDFMFKAGTMRNTIESEIINIFSNALAENEVYAIRLAFYIRDIRGGQGERRVFRTCMNYLANSRPETFKQIISFIPEYGRWDDLIYLYNKINSSNIKKDIFNIISKQFLEDIQNCTKDKNISLLAKWMPSENASSTTTKETAKIFIKNFGITPKEYRKTLSALRKKIDIVEAKMSTKSFSEINYSNVPSIAMQKYTNAFKRNDNDRFIKYIDDLTNPESIAKVNAATLYPFDIVKKIMYEYYNPDPANIKLYDAQWKALPDFFKDKFDNALVVADTSGSMSGNPINVCLGLAIYLAERNKGMFNNKFITFSNNPTLQNIIGTNIYEKVINLSKADWEMNTDIDKVFRLIYTTAIKNKLTQADLPSFIYIISDMQFDEGCDNKDITVFEKWQNKFAEAKYKLPTICFWNVSSYGNNNMPITIDNTGAVLCSGYSPSVIKYIMESDITDTMQLIKNIVESKRYNCILTKN